MINLSRINPQCNSTPDIVCRPLSPIDQLKELITSRDSVGLKVFLESGSTELLDASQAASLCFQYAGEYFDQVDILLNSRPQVMKLVLESENSEQKKALEEIIVKRGALEEEKETFRGYLRTELPMNEKTRIRLYENFDLLCKGGAEKTYLDLLTARQLEEKFPYLSSRLLVADKDLNRGLEKYGFRSVYDRASAELEQKMLRLEIEDATEWLQCDSKGNPLRELDKTTKECLFESLKEFCSGKEPTRRIVDKDTETLIKDNLPRLSQHLLRYEIISALKRRYGDEIERLVTDHQKLYREYSLKKALYGTDDFRMYLTRVGEKVENVGSLESGSIIVAARANADDWDVHGSICIVGKDVYPEKVIELGRGAVTQFLKGEIVAEIKDSRSSEKYDLRVVTDFVGSNENTNYGKALMDQYANFAKRGLLFKLNEKYTANHIDAGVKQFAKTIGPSGLRFLGKNFNCNHVSRMIIEHSADSHHSS